MLGNYFYLKDFHEFNDIFLPVFLWIFKKKLIKSQSNVNNFRKKNESKSRKVFIIEI
jgi:hypothetical protein